jgi:hypothetical protein
MSSCQFAALQAEFNALSERFQGTRDLAQRQALIEESYRLIERINAIIGASDQTAKEVGQGQT